MIVHVSCDFILTGACLIDILVTDGESNGRLCYFIKITEAVIKNFYAQANRVKAQEISLFDFLGCSLIYVFQVLLRKQLIAINKSIFNVVHPFLTLERLNNSKSSNI